MTASPRDPNTHARHPHLPAEETGALVDAAIAALTQITGTGYLSPSPTAALNQQATPRGQDLTTALATGEATWQHDVLSSIENLTAEREWITATIAHATATGRPLTDAAATRMLLDIANNDLRDHAVAGIDHRSARTHVDLWADLTARAPASYRDAPATLTAHTLWLDSQPDDARNSLALAPNRERYVLAQLIDGALDMNLDPRQAISPPVPLVWPPPQRPRPVPGQPHHHAAAVNLPPRPHPSPNTAAARVDYGPPA